MSERTIRNSEAEIDIVKLYLKEIGQIPLLTKEQEVELAQAIETGKTARQQLEDSDANDLKPRDLQAIEELIAAGYQAKIDFARANLRLVVNYAKQYTQIGGLEMMDLIEEGNFGLMHAVEKFNWRKGFKFSTYASFWIKQAIDRGIKNTSRMIRLPVHEGDNLQRLRRATNNLTLRIGRPPTIEEIAQEFGCSPEEIKRYYELENTHLSLDDPLRDDSKTDFYDVIDDKETSGQIDERVEQIFAEGVFEKVRERLNEQEAAVFELRFCSTEDKNMSFTEIGERLNIDPTQAHRIYAKLMAKLRHPTYRPILGIIGIEIG